MSKIDETRLTEVGTKVLARFGRDETEGDLLAAVASMIVDAFAQIGEEDARRRWTQRK